MSTNRHSHTPKSSARACTRLEQLLTKAKNLKCIKRTYVCDGHLTTNMWPYRVY